jgi:hypothetical protein
MTSHGSRSATASVTRGLVLMELVDEERRTSVPCRNDGCQPEAPAASCIPDSIEETEGTYGHRERH